jgi:hypothetical protein
MAISHPTSIRLTKVLKDFLQRRAEQENRFLSQQIIHILEEWRSQWMKSRHNKPGEAGKPKVDQQ